MDILSNKMKEIIEKVDLESNDVNFLGLENIVDPNIVEANGCLILDIDHKLNVDKIDWHRVLKFHGDFTGYEASCNELRINDYLPDTTDKESIFRIAYTVMNKWAEKLKKSYPDFQFVIILSYDFEYATLRFHTLRQDEASWISDDIEHSEQAIFIKKVL
ncbi:hypothetical protein EHV15_23190 [Paenibacillus oralis]|uniref:Uncharacterized protein n=1 Tax=Paenibacillus oralis TaxID=2490856 RepID=A0A3P3U6X2_9BACL|nr:hypothetical protein [Paenibacillus oralis]RRJ65496.1 hypothetical protein EHV15_23190 [Paenibacillus oralis]